MKHIILIGYMGSGKSTVGPLLAAKVNMEFVDIDEFIEKSEGMSISDMISVWRGVFPPEGTGCLGRYWNIIRV